MHLGDQVCSKTCDENCPPGWQCSLVTMSGSDPAQVCVSKAGQLCRPCTTHEDCASDEGEAPCLSYGEAGAFCGAPCDETSPCPAGYSCKETTTSDGGLSVQCVSESGACECSETSTSLALSTPCAITNAWGTCHGLNRCAPQGLTGCDALTPAQETCNGIDDDCDDEVDEVDCDDGDPCTTDSCGAEAGCIHELAEGADCDDGNPCTTGEVCSDDGCTSIAAKDCDDENPCTTDSCLPAQGCVHEASTAPCDDGDACTLGDLCSGEACQAGVESFSCDDGNPCTDDTCEPTLGCVFVANEAVCDDTNVCTTGDLCSAGLCGGVGSLDCDDDNPCTKDTCLVGGGCHYEPLEGACDDGDPCTVEDQCEGALCVSGGLKSCDDFNPCTDDLCGTQGDCEHGSNEGACDDGNPCTLGDHCVDGACKVEVMMLCNDQNPCTTDYCDPSQGCQHAAVALACDDGDACTTGDQCSEGVCAPGLALSCDDDNPCTDDSCEVIEGCGHQDNEADCDDGNACTLEDGCAAGACVGGSTPNLCGAGGTCINEGDAFSCSCALGYEGGGVDTPCLCVPVDGEWGTWSDWSDCSVSCGGGTQSRTRACTDPSPNVCGADCAGSSFESQSCNTQACCGDIGGSCFSDGQCCSGHCWINADGDNFGAPTGKICQTSAGPTNQLDCDDTCATCYPGSDVWTDSPDGLDQDCDGLTDENDGVPAKTCNFSGNYKWSVVDECKAYCGSPSTPDLGATTDCDSQPSTVLTNAWIVTAWDTCEGEFVTYGWITPCSNTNKDIECSCPPN